MMSAAVRNVCGGGGGGGGGDVTEVYLQQAVRKFIGEGSYLQRRH
jgi:hypothetical protein